MVNETFEALSKEALFTREMLSSGVTEIRNANYAARGVYFQAFTSLSTGFERIGKLCLMLDHYIEHGERFPDASYMKDEICHKIAVIYAKSAGVIKKRSFSMRFLKNLDDPIHQAILNVLSEFAQGDRYSNINVLVGGKRQNDPIASWFARVDQPLYNDCVSEKKKEVIRRNSLTVAQALGPHMMVRHTSETGTDITGVEEASQRTGVYEAVAPYRQLYVLQIARYWVELLYELEDMAMKKGSQDVPFFSEIFAPFYNYDSYFRKRKTWDRL